MTDYKKLAKQLGKRGGDATLDRHSAEHFKRISKLGVEARERKKKLPLDRQPTA